MAISICDVSKFAEIALQPAPKCICEECDDPNYWDVTETEPRRFECDGCKRSVPWCFGCDDESPMGDEMFEYCDACWAAVFAFQNQVLALQSNGAIASNKENEV